MTFGGYIVSVLLLGAVCVGALFGLDALGVLDAIGQTASGVLGMALGAVCVFLPFTWTFQ